MRSNWWKGVGRIDDIGTDLKKGIGGDIKHRRKKQMDKKKGMRRGWPPLDGLKSVRKRLRLSTASQTSGVSSSQKPRSKTDVPLLFGSAGASHTHRFPST